MSDRATLSSNRSNSPHIDPLWGFHLVQHVSSIPKLGFSYFRIVPHWARLCLKEPNLVYRARNPPHWHFVVCFFGAACLGCSNCAVCPQYVQLNRLAYSWSRFVPHGAYLCLTEPHLVLTGRIHPTSTLCGVFTWCSMSPASPSKGLAISELCPIGLVYVWKSPIWFIELEIPHIDTLWCV